MTSVNINEPTSVKIASVTFYCDKMRISASTTVHQAVTVSGTSMMTNKLRHYSTITFSGRIHNSDNALLVAIVANNINGAADLDIVYKDIKFRKCIITAVEAEDTGDEYINLSISVSTGSGAVVVSD